MELISNRHLYCEPVMWTHDGGPLRRDEQHAFRYQVGQNGFLIGFITADRARSHPAVMWEISFIQDWETVELAGKYKSVQEALAAF